MNVLCECDIPSGWRRFTIDPVCTRADSASYLACGLWNTSGVFNPSVPENLPSCTQKLFSSLLAWGKCANLASANESVDCGSSPQTQPELIFSTAAGLAFFVNTFFSFSLICFSLDQRLLNNSVTFILTQVPPQVSSQSKFPRSRRHIWDGMVVTAMMRG